MGVQKVGTWGGAEIVSGGISHDGNIDITNPLTSYYYGDSTISPPAIVGIGHAETLHAYERLLNPIPTAAPSCQHCWCGDPGPYNGKPHVSCCMCATRRVAS